MRIILTLISLLVCTSLFAQDSLQIQERKAPRSSENVQRENNDLFEIQERTNFSMNDRNFTFTPEEHGIRVYNLENGKETEYGFLRRTTTDGFFIMTSTLTDDTYFGRFDDKGNLRSYRFNAEEDTVIEENFMIQDPVERRDRNRRNGQSMPKNKNRNGNN